MARWVEVLNAFVQKESWGVRELAAATGLPRSATHRILHEMRRLGLLTAADDGKGVFQIGPVLARTAVVVSKRLDITRVGRPVLESVAQRTSETVILGLYAPTRKQVFGVDAVESPHFVRVIWQPVPQWRDLHVGATGKGVLAFLPANERDAILAKLPDPLLLARQVPKAELLQQIDDAQRLGYVVSRGESNPGAVAVASPIRDAHGDVVADLVISWPDNRTSLEREREFGEIARDAANEISRQLGHAPKLPVVAAPA
jgi:IclR family acetate operon transcriptional repressor